VERSAAIRRHYASSLTTDPASVDPSLGATALPALWRQTGLAEAAEHSNGSDGAPRRGSSERWAGGGRTEFFARRAERA